MEDDGTEAALAVLFPADDRPASVFGWRTPILRVPASDDLEDPDDGTSSEDAFILWINLMELVDLPAYLPVTDPDAQGITWIVN